MFESPNLLRENPGYLIWQTKMTNSQDPFSEILNLANSKAICSGSMTAEEPWAVLLPPPAMLKFFAVMRGRCYLKVEGEAEPHELHEGDVVLFNMSRRYILASDLSMEPIDVAKHYKPNVTKAQLGNGKDFAMIGCHAHLDRSSGFSIVDVLPEMIHLRAESAQAPVLKWLLDQLVQESNNDLPGGAAAAAQIAHLIFIHVLRAHLNSNTTMPAGWLRAMSDERLLPAVRQMHNEPGRAWSLIELAKTANMSRTTFAEHFKNVAGVAPLAYLTEWRMRLAEAALREKDVSVSDLSESLGYTSVSAFSNAFKRVIGKAPQRVRTDARQHVDEDAAMAMMMVGT